MCCERDFSSLEDYSEHKNYQVKFYLTTQFIMVLSFSPVWYVCTCLCASMCVYTQRIFSVDK